MLHIPKAVQIIAIADWAYEFNQLSTHPIREIPKYLRKPYYSPKKAQGQFPQEPIWAELEVTDVQTRSHALLLYLCMLQYWEDETAISEGALFGGHHQKPSALVVYIMTWVNWGLNDRFQVKWSSIMGNTLWLATQQHLSKEEFDQFYTEKKPETMSQLEEATKDAWCRTMEESTQMESGTQSVAPSQATVPQSREG